MTLEELVDAVRFILDDRSPQPQFATADLVRLYNEAIDEACIRTRVIQDSTSALATMAVVADQDFYPIDPSIFAIRRARLDGVRDPLDLRDTAELDHDLPGWDDPDITPAGRPRYAVFDHSTHMMRLVPRAAEAGTLRLLLWRGPTEDQKLMEADPQGEPAIPVHMHRELKHWVAAHCLLNPDSEARNPTLAGEQMALFDAAYGRKPSLHEIRLWSTNRRRRVRACWE